jgi:hypothetical protein
MSGICRRLCGAVLAVLWGIGAAAAATMDFTLVERDLRPQGDLYQWIFADGEIGEDSAQKFKDFVARNPQLMAGATVILNSPGGSVIDGMRLGDEIRDRHFRTDVGQPTADRSDLAKAECSSACVFAYLGGDYRYLSGASAIGVHRFRFEEELGGEVTAEISQALSGQIVDYIVKSRADPALFTLMTQTSPDSIHIVPREELERLKVVTGDVYSEEWSYEMQDNAAYLKADQITWRGRNKLLFVCPPGEQKVPLLMTISELPDRDEIIKSTKTVLLILDGKPLPVVPEAVIQAPEANGEANIRWTIALSPQFIKLLKLAGSIGSGLTPGPLDMFAGVAGINVEPGRGKLDKFIDQCR